MEKHPSLIKFGKQVRKLRLENGYSQESFADACDIDRAYMSGIERGLRNVSILIAIKIAKTLNIELAELFPSIKSLTGKP